MKRIIFKFRCYKNVFLSFLQFSFVSAVTGFAYIPGYGACRVLAAALSRCVSHHFVVLVHLTANSQKPALSLLVRYIVHGGHALHVVVFAGD